MSWGSFGRLVFGPNTGAALVLAATVPLLNNNKSPIPPDHLPNKNKSNVNIKGLENDRRLQETILKAREACRKLKDQNALPGLSVAVSVNGSVVWQEGMGYADIENRVKMTEDSVMRIASISKSMTMAMMAQLMEQGKIDIDAPIQTYLPKFPQKTFNGQNVSISTRHLLSHLSGIRHYKKKSEVDKENEEKAEFLKNKNLKNNNEKNGPISDANLAEFYMKQGCPDLDKAMELFKNDELFHKPGTKYMYTTHGWTVVSAIIEKLTETPFPKYAKKMFDFWGLRNTFLDEHEPIIYNRARYYSKDKKGNLINSPYVDNSCKWAGGGFLSNVQDLLRFAHIILYSKQYTTSVQDTEDGLGRAPFLKSETMSKVWEGNLVTRDTANGGDSLYALGFTVVDPFRKCMFCKERQLTRVGHSGGAVGASSTLVISFDPKHSCDKEGVQPKGVVVAIITNLIDVGLTASATEIADMFSWMV